MQAVEMQLTEKQLLLQSFRDAFERFERESNRLHILGFGDPRRLEDAFLRVERARLAYNDARDALAVSLMSPGLRTKFLCLGPSAANGPVRIKGVAELFWELAGKPTGTADDDWYRAERVLSHVLAPKEPAARVCYAGSAVS
jgi:hypothetical protein